MDTPVISIPILLLLCILLAGCNGINNTDEKTPPIGTYKATIEGELRKEDGTASGNIDVIVISHEAGCDDEKVSQGVVRTTSEGRFNKQIEDVAAKTINCITLEISGNSTFNAPDTTISFETDLKLKENEPFEEKVVNVTY